MNINTDKKYMVFAKQGQYGTMYSIGISKKDKEGKYINGYIPVHFRKDVVVEDRTEIYIKNAWLDFYLSKDNKTMVYVFINEFDTVADKVEEGNKILDKKEEAKEDPYSEFANDVEIKEEDLPF